MSDPSKKLQKDVSNPRERSDQSLSNNNTNPSLYTLGNELLEFMERESLGYQVYPGAERVDYDFTAERLNMNTTNLVEATAHLIKGCLGPGILSMHVGYMYGGIWTSLAATSFIVLAVSYCMRMLVNSAHEMYIRLRIPRLTYPDLAEVAVAMGPWKPFRSYNKTFRSMVDTCLFIEKCGTLCIYEIMIAITIKQAIESVSPTMNDMKLNERCYILIITAPLLILCLIRNIKYLAPFSLAADIFIALCVLTTMYFSTSEASNIHDLSTWNSLHGFLRFNGICLFSINGVGVTLAVENNMRKPKYFSLVLQYGMTIVLICVTVTGFFGYWGWGEKCTGPITIHMPTYTVPIILQFLIAIMLSVTFAVHLWVPFRIAWYYIGRRHKRQRGIWERFYRVVHVLLLTCWSVAFPNMIKLMLFLGNFILAFTVFIFPALIESLVTWKEPHRVIRWRLVKNCFLMLFGVFLSGAAFYSVLDL